jgi:hypothetical protein
MKLCFSVSLLLIVLGCLINDSANVTGLHNANSKSIDCNDPREYKFVIATDPDRDPKKTGTTPEILNIVTGDGTVARLKIPTDSDAQNFVVNSTEKTREGFEITVTYGTRIFYLKQFNFICKQGRFYLYKMRVESFDKFDQKSMNEPDRKEIIINPKLPIEKFSIFDYLSN